MKTLKTLLFAAIMAMTGSLTFTACSDDDNATDNGTDNNSTVSDQTDAEIISVDSIPLYEYWTNELKKEQEGNSEESERAEEAKEQLERLDSIYQAALDSLGGNSDDAGLFISKICVKVYTVRYKSVDEYGNSINLTELVAVPKNSWGWWENDPDDYVIYCHSHLFTNNERPSNYYNMYQNNLLPEDIRQAVSVATSETGNKEGVTIMPDYEGYGAAGDRKYPSMNLDLLARQTVDGYLAAVKVIADKKLCVLEDDWSTSVWGYGEGASIAAATQKYMEKNKESSSDDQMLAEKYRLRGSLQFEGYYDPEAIVKSYATGGNKVFDPIQLARMIKGLCYADPNLRGKYSADDFFCDSFKATSAYQNVDTKDKSISDFVYSLFYNSWIGNTTVWAPFVHGSSGNTSDYSWEKYYSEVSAELKSKYPEGGYGTFVIGAEDKGYYTPEPLSVSDVASRAHEYYTNREPIDFYMEAGYVLSPMLISYYKGETLSADDKAKCDALSKAFNANSLCKDWTPQYPMIVCYSTFSRNLRTSVNFTNFRTAMASATSYLRWRTSNTRFTQSSIYANTSARPDFHNYLRDLRRGKASDLDKEGGLKGYDERYDD